MLLEQGALRPMPKCYVEVYLRGGRPVMSQFVEMESPAPPPGYIPHSIFDVIPMVKALTSTGAERDRAVQAQLDQERSEAAESNDL